MKRKNLLATIAVLATLIAAFVYVPLPYSVKCVLEVQPRNATTVYALVPGVLDEMYVEAGQQVDAGDDIARLRNEDLQLRVAGYEQAVAVYRDRIDVIEHTRSRSDAEELWAQLPELRELLNSSEEQLAKAKEDLAKLQVKAAASGTVMPATIKKAPPDAGGQLPSWTGTALDPENAGAFLQANDELCRIGNPRHFEALLAVDQADINSIHAGQKVRIKLDSFPGEVFETVIEREDDISRKPMPVSPESMAMQAGGALPTQTDATGAARPISATYQVKAPLPDELGAFKIGQRGRAKISAAPQSLGRRCWRYITRTFHFEL